MTSSSWYRSSYFILKGNREYTRVGYEAASAKFSEEDLDVDLCDRHVMITGSNKGLGAQTAFELAKKGAILHLVCRNMDDANDTRSRIVRETGNDKIYLYHLDTSKPRDVVNFCESFKSSHDKLHVLVNNAGVMKHERVLDEDGIEHNFAVNTLAMHLLVTGLMPLLESCEDSRVVTVSSAGMLTVKLDPSDLSFEKMKPFDGVLAYSQNKRQQVVLTFCYAQAFSKVHFFSMHPGWADTLALSQAMPKFYESYKDKLRTVEQGADTIVWLAASPKATTFTSGLFFQDRMPVATHIPLAWTRSSLADEKLLLENIQQLAELVTKPRQVENDSQAVCESQIATNCEKTTPSPSLNSINSPKTTSSPSLKSEKIEKCAADLENSVQSDASPENLCVVQVTRDYKATSEFKSGENLVDKSEVHGSGIDKSEAHGSGIGKSEAQDSEIGKSEAQDSGIGKSEAHDSGIGKSEAHDSGIGKSEARDSGIDESEALSSGIGTSEAVASSIGKSEATDAGVGTSEALDYAVDITYSRAGVSDSADNGESASSNPNNEEYDSTKVAAAESGLITKCALKIENIKNLDKNGSVEP